MVSRAQDADANVDRRRPVPHGVFASGGPALGTPTAPTLSSRNRVGQRALLTAHACSCCAAGCSAEVCCRRLKETAVTAICPLASARLNSLEEIRRTCYYQTIGDKPYLPNRVEEDVSL